MSAVRQARIRALAKINLALHVLGRRPDGYHELRTIYQTISLADSLEFEYRPSRSTRIEVDCEPPIPDNLVVRAAEAVMEAAHIRGSVGIRLRKCIPAGAGLGGGSSDAAAVLLTLPVLAGRTLSLQELSGLAAQLGSDVPFFLLGGTALGVGRGEEVYPLPDLGRLYCVVVVPELKISTAEAYRSLREKLTPERRPFIIRDFQSAAWAAAMGAPPGDKGSSVGNDFEVLVFERFPELKSLKKRIERLHPVRVGLTGSGSGLFGLFRSRAEWEEASEQFGRVCRVFTERLVSRAEYWSWWRRWLAPHIGDRQSWPPRSRYAQ
ncbi:MAG: 4-(cytidine 5'-diphospho)-2-C-methyl-D-erythritol kinase [Bryobacterales bacterium]|nr:4-(cytidine 5'-diphospho)-2-C-methyl-D-erythritol kinase [Bryobacteraceae bacterium]MDW8354876.1 4-(cytidine 5'-diphospho)-2-C-methyl-D-erythritol kinase [Bryobacterales bacterium]